MILVFFVSMDWSAKVWQSAQLLAKICFHVALIVVLIESVNLQLVRCIALFVKKLGKGRMSSWPLPGFQV